MMIPNSPFARVEDPFSVTPEELISSLNPEQKAVVAAPRGPLLVLAGAGSGKTRTLTYRVAWLLSQGILPWEILLLTFTNKAATEMLGRVQELTGVPGYKFWGGTFHHIGQKLLRIHGELIGLQKNYTILDQGDSESLLSTVIQEKEPKWTKSKDRPKPKLVGEMISFARNTRQELKEVIRQKYPSYKEFFSELEGFAQGYRERKLQQQVVDYDDLLEHALQLLANHADVCTKYQSQFKHILVDEYQDTNPLQAALIETLAHDHQVMAVGDDGQCIYTWRGADFENILHFSKRHPGAQLHKIQTNYRSTPEILAFANHVLASRPKHLGYEKELQAVRPSGALPQVVHCTDVYQQASCIAQKIQHLLQEGYRLGDIAVLYRAHHHSMDLQMELSRQTIPYQITSGVRFFEQAHIKDLVAQLRFALNPGDTASFQRFMSLLPRVGPRTSVRVLEEAQKQAQTQKISLIEALGTEAVGAKVPTEAQSAFEELSRCLLDLEQALRSNLPREPQQGDLFNPADRLKAGPKKPLLENRPEVLVEAAIKGWYGEFLRHIHPNWESRLDDLNSLAAFASRYQTLDELLSQLALLTTESPATEGQNQEESLRLTTIHQAKGLEYPVVMVIGMADGLFPLKRAIDAGDVEEERRLFYVAVTRAMDQLYLFYPVLSGVGQYMERLKICRFIEEVPDQAYETIQLKPRYSNSKYASA